MKFSWGWKIAILYTGFAIMIGTLVVASNKQSVDLVSKQYYKEEIEYQKVIDASHNQAKLSGNVIIKANSNFVTISFPDEFKDKIVTGEVHFYAPANPQWDKVLPISTSQNNMTIPMQELHNTTYTIKIKYKVDGVEYYRESNVKLG
jgi:hypothetical protein